LFLNIFGLIKSRGVTGGHVEGMGKKINAYSFGVEIWEENTISLKP
jgi:hypothetical protein